MKELDSLYRYESTRVSGCDLSPILGLLELQDFRMRDRRGYHPSVGAVHQRLAARG
jgi:hypothetical protein